MLRTRPAGSFSTLPCGARPHTTTFRYSDRVPLAERALIERVRRRIPNNTAVRTGIGDDCAVLRIPPGREILVTTDFSLENVHFRRAWHPPDSVGHRCLARGLSDIAAMGGEPVAAFLSLALPAKLPQAWVDGFMSGLLRLATRYNVTLAGGDTAQSPQGVLADIVVLGSVPRGKAILRCTARPGDRLFVSGSLGGAAAVLHQMFRQPKRRLRPNEYTRHFFPEPRIDVGRVLRASRLASGMIDLSDGLSTDLSHICEESGVGAVLFEERIPLAAIGKDQQRVELASALHGGDDYELLFTVRSGKRVPATIAGTPVSEIGRITRERRMFLKNSRGSRELRPQGWEHFRRLSTGHGWHR